jgi:enterochelin esterase-like enzyme
MSRRPDKRNAVVLLGAQRKDPTLGAVVSKLGGASKFALITAGWQEREDEDDELNEHLGGATVNLRLHARGEEVFKEDPELAKAYRDRQQALRHSQECYRIRLEHALEADRTIRQRPAPPNLLEEEAEASIASIRALDDWHLGRCAELHRAFDAKWDLGRRPSVARHRNAIEELVRDCDAIAIAGGQVATILNRLALFAIGPLARERAVFAWAGGAMAITDRVVLFHDDPPQGPAASEVLEAGLGLARGVVVLPSPEQRLHLDPGSRRAGRGMSEHAAEFVRRFAPAHCFALPARSYVRWDSGPEAPEEGVIDLEARASERPRAARSTKTRVARRVPSKLAILGLLAEKPTSERVHAFVESHAVPIVEGTQVTFVWVGEADEVKLAHWTYGLETQTALRRIAGTDAFYLTIEIPENSRIEYKLEIRRGENKEWILDPLNPHQANDPFGTNSVLQSAGYERPSWTQPDPMARPGTVEPFVFDSTSLGGPRSGFLYLPARFRRSRVYPLLVVHDGSDYLKYASLQTVLDNLIHRLEIPDLIVAMTDSPARLREYANDEGHARYLTEELVPHLASRFPLRDTPEARGLMGASFGGIAALSTAHRYPGFWGRLLLESGSFAFTDVGRKNARGPLFDKVVAFMNQFRSEPTADSEKVYVSCGVFESLIYENRSLIPLLDKTGMQVRFDEARDGHNWENWRDRLRTGLSWLFPGPLMLVYE